jgi:hypothetical protein
MASENIKLNKDNQANFTAHNGYFYTFDHIQDNLLQKTDDGNTSFSYPYDTLMSNLVRSAEFDGVYFWSQEDPGGGNNITIRRWLVDNYMCKLQQTFVYTAGGGHDYDSQAFSVEHYHTTFSSPTNSGSTTLLMTAYSDHSSINFTTTSGDPLTLHLGPNSNDEEEDVYVDTVISGGVTISGATSPGIQYSYAASDPIQYYTHMWMFNNFDGTSSATGALYKLDAYTGDYITRYASGAYKDIKAATFYKVDSFSSLHGVVDMLCYIKTTNLLFINTGQAGATLPYYGSMVMENIKNDEATVITVYDITMDDQNIYRLQDIADGSGTTWSHYSYLLSSLDSFITSISLTAYPAMIAANTTSTSLITALVKDQFWQPPITSKTVTFSVDGTDGANLDPPSGEDTTDADGKANITLESGSTAREVKVTAVVEQG